MSLLTREELRARINSGKEGQIFMDPLLGDDQVGAVSVDLRLGYDFLVSVLNQRPSISLHPDHDHSGPEVFFQSTRRDLGDVFLIHPGQTVLATSLEYVGLPLDVYADIISRSSYHRLGISINSMFQPGFRGCVSLELFNHSNVPIELVVGSRVVQARFFRNEQAEAYMNPGQRRKYIGHVRPTISRASRDEDLPLLASLSKK
ncbi:dCTP deaminase [Aquicoccus porphyridii]|uniref:dCTP deaminase n=1 Tax=Aquicoccus porphyridii TaxID=1852029 RepID=A0A5A9ZFZ2_9RHOB|nr:dCTP deaminase [Aquicoccus porphyridii]KAA0916151.1 dCTP deaminase [Aquicoccus porphyridii]RAI52790.1 dCTP deaminase [Rhodobacteraceae bacterium AsT-22]